MWPLRYLSSESDINLLIRGIRLILKLAHSEPLKSQLEFRYGNTNKKDYFWICDQDPDKVCLMSLARFSHFLHILHYRD